jgi:hypothetical protein
LGGGLRLDYLIGVDGSRGIAGAMSLGSLERPRTSYRPPVPHEFTEAQAWMPEFFRLLASKFSNGGYEPLTIAITSYLDAESDHLDGAYLKAQVGLEAFAKRITTQESAEILVKNDTNWKRWVSTVEPDIKKHLIDPKSIDVIKGKIIGSMYAPSGDLARKAFETYGVSLPRDVRDEIKKRNYPAHGFLMNRSIEYDIDKDFRRLEMIQTVLVALVSCYIGYSGPIYGYDTTDNGGRHLPDWWPVRSRERDVWIRYLAKRHAVAPHPQSPNDGRTSATRERAYFLWKDRTGSAWWDASSNWLEAEKIEHARNSRVPT